MQDYFVSDKAKIGKNVSIGKGAVIYDNVEIGDNTHIGPYAIIGEPTMDFYKNPDHEHKKTVVGLNSIIRSHTVIYESVVIGDYFITGHHALIRENSQIGDHSSIGTYSEIFGNVKIGNHVRIHSRVGIGELTVIDSYVWIFPYVFITNDKYPPHGDIKECHIAEYAVLLSQSTIMPGVCIGRDALVGAGSIVTKDVGNERLVVGIPARDVKSVRDIRDSEGNQVYPWREYLKDYRGYPWQEDPDTLKK